MYKRGKNGYDRRPGHAMQGHARSGLDEYRVLDKSLFSIGLDVQTVEDDEDV